MLTRNILNINTNHKIGIIIVHGEIHIDIPLFTITTWKQYVTYVHFFAVICHLSTESHNTTFRVQLTYNFYWKIRCKLRENLNFSAPILYPLAPKWIAIRQPPACSRGPWGFHMSIIIHIISYNHIQSESDKWQSAS